jgi:hypothetical protein
MKTGKIKNKIEQLISDSDSRRLTWEWMKRICFVLTTFALLMGTFQRWHFFHDEIKYTADQSHLNLTYAGQIEMEVYLMTQQNVMNLFEGKPPNPDTQTILKTSDLYDKPKPDPADPRFYLVIRLKNRGDQVAWGILDYFVEGEKTREVEIPSLPSHMRDYKNIILEASRIDKSLPGSYPHLEVKWQQLFTTRGEKP